ncbi:MAG: phosphatase, partial [Actinomycetota bacterium]
MESLALLATLIVAPAMFGGPIALLLTLWKLSTVSKFREISIYFLSSSSCVVGVFLIFRDI